MAKYKIQDSGVLDTEAGAFIPNAPGNRHWQEYQEWIAQGNIPDPLETLLEAQTRRIVEVKAAAGIHIVTAYPEWKQRNMIARQAELQDIVINGGTLSATEQDEMTTMQNIWNWVKTVRSESDTFEASINSASDVATVDAIVFTFTAAV